MNHRVTNGQLQGIHQHTHWYMPTGLTAPGEKGPGAPDPKAHGGGGRDPAMHWTLRGHQDDEEEAARGGGAGG